jgi:flagellum-specific peptidoglycan hydrolase FlgJ
MTPKEFVSAFFPFAKQTEDKSGISAIAILSQAAQESGWGKYAPGFMFFGVKDTDGKNGNEQLLTTTEYSKRQDLKFPEILHVEPVDLHGEKFFKYTIKDWFRKYNSPEECFSDHADFFIKNKRYEEALKVKSNADLFIQEIAKAGYATDPNYAKNLISIAHSIEQMI